jgi:DsbC/DsbD-like thiol-disulfide interchange protein
MPLDSVAADAGNGLRSGMAQFPGAEASDQIKPTLVADTTAIEAGKPFTAGVRFEIKNTWYTYWKFVGDIGMPLEVVLELPPGFKGLAHCNGRSRIACSGG